MMLLVFTVNKGTTHLFLSSGLLGGGLFLGAAFLAGDFLAAG